MLWVSLGQWWAVLEATFEDIFLAYTRMTTTQDRNCAASPSPWQRPRVQSTPKVQIWFPMCVPRERCDPDRSGFPGKPLTCGFLYFSIWLFHHPLSWMFCICNASKGIPVLQNFCWFCTAFFLYHLLSLLLTVGQMLLIFYSLWVVHQCWKNTPEMFAMSTATCCEARSPGLAQNKDRTKWYPVWAKTAKSFMISLTHIS